jgi:hypothetical protein
LARTTNTPTAGSGLAWAGSPIGPIRGVGRRRPRSPPRPRDRPRRGQALAGPSSSWLPLLWPSPRPPLPAATPWPHPCRAVAILSLLRSRRPWHSRRAPPRWHGRVRPERLSKRERSTPPCEQRNARLSSSSSNIGAPGERTAYLKVEKPRFLFLEGSGATAVAPIVAAIALAGAPAVLVGASAARAAPSTNRPTAGAHAPATCACSSAASAALGNGGGGLHLQGGAHPRHSPLPPPPPTTSSLESPGERVPAARAAGTPRPTAPGAPAAGFSSPSCAPPSLALAAAQRGWPPGPGASVDSTVRHPRSPSANGIRQDHTDTSRGTERKGEAYLPAGRREA